MKVGRGCENVLPDGVCGWNAHPAALHWDHVEEKTHLYAAAFHINWSWDRIMAEVAKCEVVCANCHAIRTAERGYYDPRSGPVIQRSTVRGVPVPESDVPNPCPPSPPTPRKRRTRPDPPPPGFDDESWEAAKAVGRQLRIDRALTCAERHERRRENRDTPPTIA